MTVAQLCAHFEQRELTRSNTWRSYSTKCAYAVYLRRWIIPQWGKYQLREVRTIEVEPWLRRLPLARSSCAKIRGVMSVLFNHACRYEFFDHNPIRLVRQGAKRKAAPNVLTPDEIKTLMDGLAIRERTLVLLAASTGMRQSELFGLKWRDINFAESLIHITRSIVCGVVGPCKTESSQKPVPVHPNMIETLLAWKERQQYHKPDDWVFAIKRYRGRKPYWGQAILRKFILPKPRNSVSKALRLAHIPAYVFHAPTERGNRIQGDAGIVATLFTAIDVEVYTQPITPSKHAAQDAVTHLFWRPRVFELRHKSATSVLRKSTSKRAQKGHKSMPFAPSVVPAHSKQLFWNVWRGRRGSNPRPLP